MATMKSVLSGAKNEIEVVEVERAAAPRCETATPSLQPPCVGLPADDSLPARTTKRLLVRRDR